MSEQNEEASDDFGIFIIGDGQRVTDAPWRLQTYDRAGPLTNSQISVLAHRFDLPVASLAKLSKHLGHVLNPAENIHLIPASRSKARQSAKSDVTYAKRHLKTMRARLSEVIERLSSLISEDYDEGNPHSPPYAAMLGSLETSLKALTQAEGALQSLAGQPVALVRWQALDKRELKDRRRDEVLGAIFQFWVDAGRKVTFSTDPLTSKRGGELVLFTQAVCECLTDPPTELKAETIVKSIRAKGKTYQPMPDWARSFPTPEELASVLNASDD